MVKRDQLELLCKNVETRFNHFHHKGIGKMNLSMESIKNTSQRPIIFALITV